MNELYDTIILGGGPAGVSAAIYAARKKLKVLLLTESFGGQSIVSSDIENWIGEENISGIELAKKLEKHVRKYDGQVEIKTPETVIKVKKTECRDGKRASDFKVYTKSGLIYEGKTVIVVLGAHRRKLDVPGEDIFEGKGISYCATCDAPFFKDKKVAVIGGGNAGAEAAIDLLSYASQIFIFQKGNSLTADGSTVERIKQEGKISVILEASIKEVIGTKKVEGIIYEDKNGTENKIDIGGVFVEIGSTPNSESLKGLVDIDKYGQIKIDPRHGATSFPGIFAAGDVTNDPYKQNNISAGDAIKAALAAYAYVQNLKKRSPAEEVC